MKNQNSHVQTNTVALGLSIATLSSHTSVTQESLSDCIPKFFKATQLCKYNNIKDDQRGWSTSLVKMG